MLIISDVTVNGPVTATPSSVAEAFGLVLNPKAPRCNVGPLRSPEISGSDDVMKFDGYDTTGFYDEMFAANAQPRPEAEPLVARIESLSVGDLHRRQQAAEKTLLQMGITFNVYGEQEGTERIWPFDLVPRIVEADEWDWIERGLRQRITALNLFINDIYHEQRIIKDGVVPRDIIESATAFRPACMGLNPPGNVWCHITGTDLVRHSDGQIYVLEDNMRCPSGVSYVLENREIMKRTFPQVFAASRVRPVAEYPSQMLAMLESLAPKGVSNPTVVVLTPGVYNSAYFEHSFLARQMGVELVEGRDLVVSDGFVLMRTTKGYERVDVIYRRVDDDFLDPKVFRADSMLGVPGLFDVFKAGRVALANAPGTGVADDKVIYCYVPRIVKYYLDQDILIPNVPTWMCWEEESRAHVLKNLDSLVVKAANESGGYGMLIGPHSTPEQRDKFATLITENPRNYIAQPTLSLSRVPTICGDRFEGRHVDLRPYILYGKEIFVLPGGLTRVALRKGSLVVNSSQGGGSKDTWVIARSPGNNGGDRASIVDTTPVPVATSAVPGAGGQSQSQSQSQASGGDSQKQQQSG